MFVFRLKQQKIENYSINQLNKIGLSRRFINWYLKEWMKKNLNEVDKSTKEKACSKVKI